MVACDDMKRARLPMFVLLVTAALAQSPAQSQGQRPAMAVTPNTDLYYKLPPDAIP